MPSHLPERHQQGQLFGQEKPPPDPANEVRKAWARGFAETYGKQPPAVLMNRVAGKVKEIGRTSPSLDEWRDWWDAALRAGRSGSWDVVSHYAPRRTDAPSNTDRIAQQVAQLRERGL